MICPLITQLILLFANQAGKINLCVCQSSIIFCTCADTGAGVGVDSCAQISVKLTIQPFSSRAFFTLEGVNFVLTHIPLGFLT